jgi:hypothetical protein
LKNFKEFGLSIWSQRRRLSPSSGASRQAVDFAAALELGRAAFVMRSQRVHKRRKELQSGIVFLHEMAPGAADRSYGIQVAKLVGLPSDVLKRPQEVLHALERGDSGRRAWQ